MRHTLPADIPYPNQSVPTKLCYTLHCYIECEMAKQIFLYKLAKDLAEQLDQQEADLEEEYENNEQNVTIDNDDEDDGTDVLKDHDDKLKEFTRMQNDERQKLVQSQKHCVLSNLQERKFGNPRVLSRERNMSLKRVHQQNKTEAQQKMNDLQDEVQDIRQGKLFTFFRVRDQITEELDLVYDHIFMVDNPDLNHEQLLAIADRSACLVGFDLRKY